MYESEIMPTFQELEVTGKDKLESGRYTWEKKYAVVATYLATGNMRATAKKHGIIAATLETWRKASWWPDIVQEVKNTDSAVLKAKLNKSVDKALEIIQDRLENGETVLNQKTGEFIKKEVSLRDATSAAAQLMQRQAAIEKNTYEQEVGRQTTQETLKFLAQEFAKFNNAKSQDLEYVEVIDANKRALGSHDS
jgi:transposase-like protein